MAMFAENIEHIDMIRTPLKDRNQEYTPALGKRQANRMMFATPTKRMMTATPRSVLGKKTNCETPSNMFKKPRMSPGMKLHFRTPGKCNIYKQASTPGKFSIYEDSEVEDEIQGEMKRKNFKIEEPEKCPWADKSKDTARSAPPPPLELVDDFVCHEPTRKKMRPIKLDPLPIGKDQEELLFNLDTEYALPDLPELPDFPELPTDQYDEVELCPWANISSVSDGLDTTPEELELDMSTLSDLDITREKLSEISIRCFNESYAQLESALSDDELPDIPSTPDLDQQLVELLELSFDTFNW